MNREIAFDSVSQRSRTKAHARTLSAITPQDFKENKNKHVRVAEDFVNTLDSRTDI